MIGSIEYQNHLGMLSNTDWHRHKHIGVGLSKKEKVRIPSKTIHQKKAEEDAENIKSALWVEELLPCIAVLCLATDNREGWKTAKAELIC